MDRNRLQFENELPASLVDYGFFSGLAFIPGLVGIAIAYLLNFKSVAGQWAACIGMGISGVGLLYVSIQFWKSRWKAGNEDSFH